MALSLLKYVLQVVTLIAVTTVSNEAMSSGDNKLYGQVPSGDHPQQTESRKLKLWHIDINRKGTQCLLDPEHLQFWRENADKARTVRLSGPANFPSAAIDFAAGQAVVDVDSATFPVGDGLSVTVSDAETGATLGEIVIAVLTTDLDTPKKVADALKDRGCLAQLKILESSTAHPKA